MDRLHPQIVSLILKGANLSLWGRSTNLKPPVDKVSYRQVVFLMLLRDNLRQYLLILLASIGVMDVKAGRMYNIY